MASCIILQSYTTLGHLSPQPSWSCRAIQSFQTQRTIFHYYTSSGLYNELMNVRATSSSFKLKIFGPQMPKSFKMIAQKAHVVTLNGNSTFLRCFTMTAHTSTSPCNFFRLVLVCAIVKTPFTSLLLNQII